MNDPIEQKETAVQKNDSADINSDDNPKTKRCTNFFITMLFMLIIGTTTPALSYAGFIENFILSLPICMIMCSLSGIAIGVTYSIFSGSETRGYFINSLTGLIYSMSTFWAMAGYLALRRNFLSIELIIPFIAGLIPVLIIILIRTRLKKDT